MQRNGNTPRISLPDRWQWDDERLKAVARVVEVIQDAQDVIKEHEDLLLDPNTPRKSTCSRHRREWRGFCATWPLKLRR